MKRIYRVLFIISILIPFVGHSQTNPDCEAIGITEVLNFNTCVFNATNPGSPEVFPGDDFCVAFKVENFTNVQTFQFTLNFDPTQLCFISSFISPGVLTGLIVADTNRVREGILPLVWFDANASGNTVPDGTEIWNVCFEAKGDPSDCIPLGYVDGVSGVPSIEVSYINAAGMTCAHDGLLIDSSPDSTCIELGCNALSIYDVGVCNSQAGMSSIRFSVCGGEPIVSYTVSNGVATLTDTVDDFEEVQINNLPPGTYDITVIDGAGNTDRETITLVAAVGLNFDFDITNPSCGTAQNGDITITNIFGGQAPYIVRAPNGFTYQNVLSGESLPIERLGNGTYNVSIEDSQGCQLELPIDLLTDTLSAIVEFTPATCVGANDGSIRVIPIGGTPDGNGEYNMGGFLNSVYESDSPFLDNFYLGFSGMWEMTIEDSNGCTYRVVEEIPVLDTIAYAVTIDDVMCKGDSTASLIIAVTNPNPTSNYSYILFDDSGNFLTIPGAVRNDSLIHDGNLPAGDYSFQIRDVTTGCDQLGEFTINEPPTEIELTSSSTPPDCNGLGGSATVEAMGGMGNYTYLWEDSLTHLMPTLSDISAGMYTVTVQDDFGCLDSITIDVPQGPILEIETSILSSLNCDNSGSGEFTFMVTDGGPADSNTWFQDSNPIGSEVNQTYTEPGLYWVEVLGNGCTVRDTIIIDPAGGLTFDTTIVVPSCPTFNNGSITIFNIQGGSGNYDCDWSHAFDGCDPIGMVPGMYSVTITDDANCERIVDFELPDNFSAITADTVVVNPCFGASTGSIAVENIMGGTAPYTCVWEDPAIQALAVDCTVEGLPAGDYNFIVMDALGCQSQLITATLTEEPAAISFDLTAQNPTCGGAKGFINIANITGAFPPLELTWDDGFIGADRIDMDAGTYTAFITDSIGCSVDTTITLINETDNFVLEIVADSLDCPDGINGSISFLGCTGCTCEWEDSSLNIQGCDLVSLGPGLYNVTITDASGCQKDTFVDLNIDTTNLFKIALGNLDRTSCFEGDDGFAEVSVENDPRGAGIYDYFWSNAQIDQGVIDATNNNLTFGENFVVGFDGVCSDTIYFEIEDPELIVLDQTAVTTEMTSCNGGCDGQATLAAMGGVSTGSYDFIWEDGVSSDFRDDLCAGLHFINIIDDNGCENIDSIIIMEPDTIIIDTLNLRNISCFVEDSGQINIEATGGCGNFSYQWSSGIDSDSGLADNLISGTYQVSITDDCGCVVIKEFTLEEANTMTVIPKVPDTPNCEGDQVCLGIEDVSGGTGTNYTYSVNFGDRIPIDSVDFNFPGPYTLTVFDEAGCSQSVQVEIPQADDFTVDLGPDLTLNLGATNQTLTANVTGGTPPFVYNWNPMDSCVTSDCASIEIVPTTFANYQVLVIDANGCEAPDEIFVEVKAVRNVYLPNTFRPESDAPNNKFMLLTGQGVEQVNYFYIYDRWGNLMYNLDNVPAPTSIDMGWDGRRGTGANSEAEAGVYAYIGEVLFEDGQTIKYKGSITLIR